MISPASRRFVPTLTEVVEPGMSAPECTLPASTPEPQGIWPVGATAPARQPIPETTNESESVALGHADLVAEIAARIVQQLDAQIQHAVAHQLQLQQQQLTQRLRLELLQAATPLIEAALQAQTPVTAGTAPR